MTGEHHFLTSAAVPSVDDDALARHHQPAGTIMRPLFSQKVAAKGRIVRVGCVLLIAMVSACGPADNAARESGRSVYAHGDSITISGTLVDSRCLHLDPANVGVDHVRPEGAVTACAQACANMGFPTAVLLDGQPGNDVWVLITVPAILADYMAETVRVSGTVRSAGVLIPSRVEYMQDGTWLNIL